MVSNVLSDLVEYGKTDVRRFVAGALAEALAGDVRHDTSRVAERMFSLLTLSIKKTGHEIAVSDIRTLIIEENLEILGEMAEFSPQIVQMFAVATGRIVQISEYLHAIGRIVPTLGAHEEAMAARFISLETSLKALRRVAVRLYQDEERHRPMLFDIRSPAQETHAGSGYDGFPAAPL